ncbi:ABC transporter ATP-binding protein [Candidatus Woesearchaeota archaeon]|nr:ABC transporter ATP-binding protein [Candidatus Woesearchaeota archaeon]
MKPVKPSAEPVISLRDVWKTYTLGRVRVDALRGLSLDVRKGEFVAVQGPSGSGKSTAMNLIGCLDYPTRGKVFLEHRDITSLSESELAQMRGRKIGFVFQQFNLIPSLTALENVTLPMVFQAVPSGKRIKRARELLSMVGLEHRTNHKPNELSGGQQQRVSIARALANNPDVILADEPTGNLDSATGKHIMEVLAGLHEKEGKTIVLVTHDERLAGMADRAEYIMDGKNVVKHK